MGNLEELLIKGAYQNARPLSKVDDLIKNLLGRVHMKTRTLFFNTCNTVQNNAAATLCGEHVCRLKYLLVV